MTFARRALPGVGVVLVVLVVLACVTATAARALGAPPPPEARASSDLVADASPVLPAGNGIALGWSEIVVSLQNHGPAPARGSIDVFVSQLGHDRGEFRASAPFHVGAGAGASVRVPALVVPYGDVQVEIIDDQGRTVADKTFATYQSNGVTLLDTTETSRLHGAMNDVAVAPLLSPSFGAAGRGPPPTVSVVSPRWDPATGDPILPDRAALYATADAVLLRSDVLTRLGGAELDALAGYVLAGGTLAVALVRPEDGSHPTVRAFVGGNVMRGALSPITLGELELPSIGALSSARALPHATSPSSELAASLATHAGGNLHPSLYGSSAAYGLGEVHVLAFDPTHRPAVDDPWALARMVDLTRRAFDRRASQIFRPGAEPLSVSYGRVRQQLDPNERSRWAIGVAALLLVAYSIVAGPVNFSLAARAGRPLRALRRLPILSAVAFALVVGVGVAAKGVTGRARHLTLVEAGAGMPKGNARRFRGFYAARAKDLTVRATDTSSLAATAVSDAADRRDHLVVDRDGARLVDVAALPWQTVVVREEGFASLGAGIALLRDEDGELRVVNRTGRDLRAAILRAPGGTATYFARLADGESATTRSGRKLGADADGRAWEGMVTSAAHVGGLDLRRLHPVALRSVLDADTPGLADAWWALSDAAGDLVDWFPDDVPVLIGQLDGGEGRAADSGLRIDADRVLVRVVGYGGRP
jgi:hypothetical protein